MLEQERRFYDDHVQEWLSSFPSRFVLVRGAELIGTFDTVEDALAEGARRFGLSSFLVRRVERQRPEVKVPVSTLGVLHAGPEHHVHGPVASRRR